MTAHGPIDMFTLEAMARPIFSFSSTVVRMSVTVGLCLYRFRDWYCSGTVSHGPKFTMSSAPTDTTAGTPFKAAALQRSGPAVSTPPAISSHHSVVVRSSTPLMKPPLTSASIHFPPVPVAWNTSTSNPFDSR